MMVSKAPIVRRSIFPAYGTISEIPSVSQNKRELRNSCPVVCTSLLNLSEDAIKGFEDNAFDSDDRYQESNKLRSRFCNNPRRITLSVRFPMNKLNTVFHNLSAKKISLIWLSNSRKNCQETVRGFNEILNSLETGDVISEKNQKLITKYLGSVKKAIFADKGEVSSSLSNNNVPTKENVMITELVSSSCLGNLILKLPLLEFEDRKVATLVFSNVMRRQVHPNYPLVNFLADHPNLLLSLIDGYRNQQMAGICGIMLRECFRYEKLSKIVLESDKFNYFFEFLKVTTFEISSDAFLTFKTLLTENKRLSSEFMAKNYETFFEKFNGLLMCDNYVTQISSLRLLAEVLLDRHNYNVMTKYVGDPKNLKRVMILMSDSHRNIQFEAYHAFKIFLANPQPTSAVRSIFMKNKNSLINFLSTFQPERDSDVFSEEKAFLTKQLHDITAESSTSDTKQKNYLNCLTLKP